MNLVEFLWYWGGTLGSLLIIGVAFWRGGRYERFGAAVFLAALILTWILNRPGVGFEPAVMMVDTITCVIYVGLALQARRVWTLFMAAFALNTVLSHLIILLDPGVDLYVYVTGIGLWGGYGLMLALAGGVWEHRMLERLPKSGTHFLDKKAR